MASSTTFESALREIEHLPDEEQAELIDLVKRRLTDRRRQQFIDEVKEAEADFKAGRTRRMTVDEIMKEFGSEA